MRIEPIPSSSPRGRGRMERLWGTLQKRLPPLLRQAGAFAIETANRWLKEVSMANPMLASPWRRQRKARPLMASLSNHVPFVGDLDEILGVEEERVVANDNKVRPARPRSANPRGETPSPLRRGQAARPPLLGWLARPLARAAPDRALRGRRLARRRRRKTRGRTAKSAA